MISLFKQRQFLDWITVACNTGGDGASSVWCSPGESDAVLCNNGNSQIQQFSWTFKDIGFDKNDRTNYYPYPPILKSLFARSLTTGHSCITRTTADQSVSPRPEWVSGSPSPKEKTLTESSRHWLRNSIHYPKTSWKTSGHSGTRSFGQGLPIHDRKPQAHEDPEEPWPGHHLPV